MNFKLYKIQLLIIKSLILSSILYTFILSIELSKHFNKDNIPKETYKILKNNKTFIYLKNYIRHKFNLFIYKCLKYDYQYYYPLSLKPKISAIIPLYNAESYIKSSLSSIQNQKMKDIEIILIDDCSEDNTLFIVNELMKKDKRIRLIKNTENRKILYSKSIAALNANGEYIIQLDQDDIFIRDDVLDILYNEAKQYDLDLVQIRDIYNDNYILNKDIRVNYPAKHFIKRQIYNNSYPETQPELKNEIFIKGNLYLLWGLLIKTDIYKKAIYHLWPLILNYQLIYYEDYVVTSVIISLTNKFKYLNKFALIHLNHTNSAMLKFYDQFYISVLICQNILFNFLIKDQPKDIIILMNYLKRYKKIYNISNSLYKKYFSYNIINILNNEYLTYNDRLFIFHLLNSNYSEYQYLNSYKYYMNSSEFNKIVNFDKLTSNYSLDHINYLNPKISVIVYCLNFTFVNKTLYSILHQRNISFEIILIYDNRINNILISDYLPNSKNIKIICNNFTKGILTSFINGALNAKGDYLLFLNVGETLAKNDILNKLYYKMKNNTYEILEFNILINNIESIKENSLKLYICKHMDSQFNFSSFKYNKNYDGLDQEKELITNKFIRKSFFNKIISKYKLDQIKNNLSIYFDKILLFLFLKENAILIRYELFGVVKYINTINLYNKNDLVDIKIRKLNESIFYINFLFENSKNTFKEKEYILYEFFNELSIIFNKFNKMNDESKQLYNKFLNCKYISTFYKNKLKFYYKSLIN